jgi:hypothetical protein
MAIDQKLIFRGWDTRHISAQQIVLIEGTLGAETAHNFSSSFTCMTDENVNSAVYEQCLTIWKLTQT